MRKVHPKAQVETLPGGRGDFVVKVDGQLVWDKKGREGRFPEPAEILARCAPQ